MSNKVIGSYCQYQLDCFSRVTGSYCTFRNVCECQYGYLYQGGQGQRREECLKPKAYGEKCRPSSSPYPTDGCHHELLVCTEYGACVCHKGFHFQPEKSPFCQPNNNSSCSPGHFWDTLRGRCVSRQRLSVWVEGGVYERNRYSLFFAVILLLLMMVILLKGKRKFGLPVAGQRSGRRPTRRPSGGHLHNQPQVQANCMESLWEPPFSDPLQQLGRNDVSLFSPVSPLPLPPPAYSSVTDLSNAVTIDMSEKPPPYEEAVLMPPSS